MNSWNHDDIDRCSFCNKADVCSQTEEWTTEAGDIISLPVSTNLFALADTSVGELWICESCYLANKFIDLPKDDLAEIHYSMGLEYRDFEQLERSNESLFESLKYSTSADTLAAIASNYDELNKVDLAIKFYKAALSVDPQHFMSTENLKLL